VKFLERPVETINPEEAKQLRLLLIERKKTKYYANLIVKIAYATYFVGVLSLTFGYTFKIISVNTLIYGMLGIIFGVTSIMMVLLLKMRSKMIRINRALLKLGYEPKEAVKTYCFNYCSDPKILSLMPYIECMNRCIKKFGETDASPRIQPRTK